MYTDFIQYRLAAGITQDTLLAAAKDVLESWMKNQPGFISWEIHKLSTEGDFLDTVRWESHEAAKLAEKAMQTDLPAENPWFACYDFTSIVSTNGTLLQ